AGNDENVIGAFSNSSLVCPGYKSIKDEFEKEFSRCPGLFRNEEDDEGVYPLTFIRKTRFRCFFMYKWISAVLEILRKINVYKNKEKFCDKKGYLDILINELKQFQKEITEDILDKEVRDEMKGLVKVKIKDEYLKVNEESKAFKKLSTDEQKEKKDSIRKNVRKFIENGNIRNLFEMIEVTIDFNVPYIKDTIKQGNRYFIEAIEEIGEKAEGIELKRIYDMADDENSLYNIVHLDESQVLQKDDIFTNKLGIIYDPANPENGVPMLEKHFVKIGNRKIEGGGDIEYCSYALIPIKKAVINDELLGVDYNSIKRNINYENIGDSILVTLNGSGRPVTHKYTKDKIINISFAKLPNICIWPYTRIKNVNGESVWNDYYAYIERKNSVGRRNRGNTEENEKIVYSFKRDTDDKRNKLDLASGRLGERVVVKLNELPEYIFVDNKTPSSSEEAGIIILSEPEREDVVIPSVGEPAILGIDFGTTSSTMFCKIGDDPVKFVEFGAKYKMNLRNNQWERKSVDSQEDICIEEIVMSGDPEPYFMPKQFFDRKAYLSSYLLTSKSPDMNNEMLMIGHIVFDETQTGNNDNTRLFKNAKWGRRDIDETIRHGYLMQILKMAEFTILKTGRVKSIKLRASYPTALSDFNKINLKNNYKNIINALNKSASVFSFDGLFTESISSALVFRNASTINYACIDIGGGSTDISLWKFNTAENRNENIFQSSFKFASRDIFVPALARFVLLSSPEPGDESKLQVNIKRLNSKYADAIDNAKKNYDSDPRETISSLGIELEEALFKFSDDIIALHDSADYDIVKVFDRDIITGFLAIVYYTVISYANGVRNYGFEKIVGDLNICFAGNGSKMYNWIDSEYLERMQKMLTVLANHKDMGGIFSGKGHKVCFREPDMQELKTEAARGLIEVTEAENTKNNDILINGDFICFRTKSGRNIAYSAGDNIKEKKKIKNLFSDNKGKEDADGIREPNFKFDDFLKGDTSDKYFTEIERFVNVLNKVLKYDEMQIDFNDSVKRAFRKRFAEVYHEFMMEKSIIPVFIAEVIAFMDVIKEDNYYDEEDLDDDYSFDDEEYDD
ncbi:MAG: hypothetical protein IJ583_10655, partial [Firmicutes bacterium]|nr:hypothetical protein [Bacillota bacterium]